MNRRELTRQLTALENGAPPPPLQPGAAALLGITGPPGVGKSTLIDRLIDCYRRANHTVAVLAIDPSSPISGGALLGDRLQIGRAHV